MSVKVSVTNLTTQSLSPIRRSRLKIRLLREVRNKKRISRKLFHQKKREIHQKIITKNNLVLYPSSLKNISSKTQETPNLK